MRGTTNVLRCPRCEGHYECVARGLQILSMLRLPKTLGSTAFDEASFIGGSSSPPSPIALMHFGHFAYDVASNSSNCIEAEWLAVDLQETRIFSAVTI